MSNLVDYLLDLAADPDRCARFKADPESELRLAGLNESDKKAVATRDPRLISQAIAEQGSEPGMTLRWLLAVFSESGS